MTHSASQSLICLLLTSESWYCENSSLGARSHLEILGASRSWRSFVSTCALLVQLLKDIPAPDTQPWLYLAKQLLFARFCSFLRTQCNYKWIQQRRKVECDWSWKILCKYTLVIRCHDGFGLVWGQRRCVYICCNVSFKGEHFTLMTLTVLSHRRERVKWGRCRPAWQTCSSSMHRMLRMDGWMDVFPLSDIKPNRQQGTITSQQLLAGKRRRG